MKLFAAASCLLINAGLFAQETSRAVIKTNSHLVLVDAVVTGKKGTFIHGLSQNDFKVFEDNREQTITSFSFEADPASPVNNQPHYLMFFFDNASLDIPYQQPIRDAAAQFAAANAGPRNLMSVVDYGPSLQITQDFTGDGEKLKQSISKARLAHRPQGTFEAGEGTNWQRVAGDTWALERVAKMLGKIPGRKSLILVSGSLAMQNDQRSRVIDELNKADVAVYAGADLAGLSTTSGGQLLSILMESTGGSMFYLKDLSGGFDRIGREQNEYYLIGYTPEVVEEGKCHRIKVKVLAPGTLVRSRSYYCPVKPADLLSGTPIEKDLENLISEWGTGTVKAFAQAPFFYSESGSVRMAVAFEFPCDAIALEKRKANKFHGQVNLLGIVYRPDGSIAARFSDTVALDFADKAAMEAWKQKPLMYYEKDVEGAPGSYTLKLVLSSAADRFAKITLPLEIPPYDGQTLGLSGLAFSVSMKKVEPGGGVESEDNTPLVANGVQFLPSARASFKKTESVALYAELLEPTRDAIANVRMRLLDAVTGQVKLDSGQIKQDQKPVVPIALMIPVAKLAPGDYVCELVASDSAGARVVRVANLTVE